MKYLLAFLMAAALPAFAQTFDTNYFIGRYESAFTRFMKTNSDYARWQTNLGIGGVIATNLKATNIVWLSTGTHTNGNGSPHSPIGVGTAALFDTYFSNSTVNTTYKFYPGTYFTLGTDLIQTNTPYIRSGQTWEGSGIDVTKITVQNQSTGLVWYTAQFAAQGIWTLTSAQAADSVSNVVFRDMTIDGAHSVTNINTNRTRQVFIMYGNGNLVERVKFTGGNGRYINTTPGLVDDRECFPFSIYGQGNVVRDCIMIMDAVWPNDYISGYTMDSNNTNAAAKFRPNLFQGCFFDGGSASNQNTAFTMGSGTIIDNCYGLNARIGAYADTAGLHDTVVRNSSFLNIGISGIYLGVASGKVTNVVFQNNVVLMSGSNTWTTARSTRPGNANAQGIHAGSAPGGVGLVITGNHVDWFGNTNSAANEPGVAYSIDGFTNGMIANNSQYGTAYAPFYISSTTANALTNPAMVWWNNRDLRTGKPIGVDGTAGFPDHMIFAGATNAGSVLTIGTNWEVYGAAAAGGGGAAISNFVSGSFTNGLTLGFTAAAGSDAVNLTLLTSVSNVAKEATNSIYSLSNKVDAISNTLVVATNNINIISNALPPTTNYVLMTNGTATGITSSNTVLTGFTAATNSSGITNDSGTFSMQIVRDVTGLAGTSNYLFRAAIATNVGGVVNLRPNATGETDFRIQTNGVIGMWRGASSGYAGFGVLGHVAGGAASAGLRTGLFINGDNVELVGGANSGGSGSRQLIMGNQQGVFVSAIRIESTNGTSAVTGASTAATIDRTTLSSMRLAVGLYNAPSTPTNGIGLIMEDVGRWTRGTANYSNATVPLPTFTNQTMIFTVVTNGDTAFGFTTGLTNQVILSASTNGTVGAAGTATALPGAPDGYLIIYVNGIQKKVPFYTP